MIPMGFVDLIRLLGSVCALDHFFKNEYEYIYIYNDPTTMVVLAYSISSKR